MPMCDFTLTRCTRPERPAMAAAICRMRGAWGLATACLQPAWTVRRRRSRAAASGRRELTALSMKPCTTGWGRDTVFYCVNK
eukprot:2181276-Rhodomonas_salina.1